MLWVEKRDVGWSIYIPKDCIAFIAKQLNEVTKVELSYQLGVASPDGAEFICVPKWGFEEARRLITLEALKEVKP